jgi:PST family polysaccharide transporter
VLSRLDRQSREFHRALMSALSTTAFVGMGLGAVLTLTGRDVIRLLLGPNWGPAGDIFMLFGPGIGVMLLYNTHSWVHLSIGTPDRWLRWVIVELTVTGLLFLVGLRFGPAGIAAAWTASFWILTIPALWYAGKPIGLPVTSAIAAVWRYVVASAVSGVATAWFVARLPGFNLPNTALGVALRIILTSFVLLAFYIGAVSGLHLSFSPIAQFGRLLRNMVPRGKLGLAR